MWVLGVGAKVAPGTVGVLEPPPVPWRRDRRDAVGGGDGGPAGVNRAYHRIAITNHQSAADKHGR